MKTIVLSIFWVTVLILTFRNICSAENMIDPVSHKSTRHQLDTTIKETDIAKVNKRKDGLRMNMLAATGRINKKKVDDGLDTISKIVTIFKDSFEGLCNFFDPIFKAKNLGLSVIATIISVIKFVMDLNKSVSMKMTGAREIGNTVIDDRIGMPYAPYPISQVAPAYRPTYLAHYPSYMPSIGQ